MTTLSQNNGLLQSEMVMQAKYAKPAHDGAPEETGDMRITISSPPPWLRNGPWALLLVFFAFGGTTSIWNGLKVQHVEQTATAVESDRREIDTKFEAMMSAMSKIQADIHSMRISQETVSTRVATLESQMREIKEKVK
jgi:hypothetical protein